MIKNDVNKTFTYSLKKEIVSNEWTFTQKKELLNGYFRNNYFPIVDNEKIKLVISNVYLFVLQYLQNCIEKLNLNLYFDLYDNETKLGKKTYFLKIYGSDLEKLEQIIGLKKEFVISTNSLDNQAFFTGAFLASGSMNNPIHQNHFEIRCATQEIGEIIIEIFQSFQIHCLTTYHKNKLVIYLKKSASISDALKIMNCSQTVLEFEANNILNIRDQNLTRTTQLEIANLAKTVDASSKQIKQIMVIKNTPYWNRFSKSEQKCFLIRLENEEYSLAEIARELSRLMNKDISRSSIQNYFKKLDKLYQEIIF